MTGFQELYILLDLRATCRAASTAKMEHLVAIVRCFNFLKKSAILDTAVALNKLFNLFHAIFSLYFSDEQVHKKQSNL